MLNRGGDSITGSNIARYRMFLTKYFCSFLEFYFPSRGKRVETKYIFCVVCTSAKMPFIWQKKFWRHLMLYIETNLYSSFFFFFCLGFLVYKGFAKFNMLGKARKDGKTKTTFRKKRISMKLMVSFDFFGTSCQLRSVQCPVFIKLRYAVQHCSKKFKFHDYRLLYSRGDISKLQVRT